MYSLQYSCVSVQQHHGVWWAAQQKSSWAAKCFVCFHIVMQLAQSWPYLSCLEWFSDCRVLKASLPSLQNLTGIAVLSLRVLYNSVASRSPASLISHHCHVAHMETIIWFISMFSIVGAITTAFVLLSCCQRQLSASLHSKHTITVAACSRCKFIISY